jgi:flavodoxin I
MKALVVFDSAYGNTEQIAKEIANGIGAQNARTLRASDARAADLSGVELLVVGSPTQGGRPTKAVQDFLKALPPGGLENIKTASFDTRITKGGTGTFAKIFGYAANRIESDLKRYGGVHLSSEGFSVKGREGPLQDGEMERARGWASKLVSQSASG